VTVVKTLESLDYNNDTLDISSEAVIQPHRQIVHVYNNPSPDLKSHTLVFTFNTMTGQHEGWKCVSLVGETRHPTPNEENDLNLDNFNFEMPINDMKSRVLLCSFFQEPVQR
jgi:hypothetical protein